MQERWDRRQISGLEAGKEPGYYGVPREAGQPHLLTMEAADRFWGINEASTPQN